MSNLYCLRRLSNQSPDIFRHILRFTNISCIANYCMQHLQEALLNFSCVSKYYKTYILILEISGGGTSNAIVPISNNYVGLVNQAMTCYLNSLLQALYMTPEFRNALYNWEFDGVNESKSIPYQLQKLFLNLQTSSKTAVETTDLTTSFGWQGKSWFFFTVFCMYFVIVSGDHYEVWNHFDDNFFVSFGWFLLGLGERKYFSMTGMQLFLLERVNLSHSSDTEDRWAFSRGCKTI